jgi:hypothetical protein
MSTSLAEAIVAGIRESAIFQDLPVMIRAENTLWEAHERVMLWLRLPLYHRRLHKAAPKPNAYNDSIQAGLTLLNAFARATGTKQAIVRLSGDHLGGISFQPRPFEANWTPRHTLSPPALVHPETDPLMLHGQLPRIQTSDFIHLAGKLALAIADRATDGGDRSGHATFEFGDTTRVVYRPRNAPHTKASHIEVLR